MKSYYTINGAFFDEKGAFIGYTVDSFVDGMEFFDKNGRNLGFSINDGDDSAALFNRTGDYVGFGAKDSAGGTLFFDDRLQDDPLSMDNPFDDDPF